MFNLTTTSKRFSPSKSNPLLCPANAVFTTLFISAIFKLYCAMASLLYSMITSGIPVTGSKYKFFAPSTVFTMAPNFCEYAARVSKFSPNILHTTSCFAPVINSLKRICTGNWKLVVIPGISATALPIFSANSLKVLAEVHSDLSFKITIISAASIGMGSVGTSPLPILVTTFSTSGN